jgi:AraC-like DNA-binding protein
MEKEKIYYVYYSYEQFGRGYIGYRGCEYEKGYTPETEPYWGTYSDKSYKPTEKIILFQDLTREEALKIEIYLHAFYDVDNNDHFANKVKQTSTGFCCDVSGTIWYNNGIKERLIFPDEEIPEGYKIGRNISGNKNPMYGQTHSEEAREKISKAKIGIKASEETRKKLSEKRNSINAKKKNRVITPSCCYFSIKNARKELKISQAKFHKLFEKDSQTRFYHLKPKEELPEGFILGYKLSPEEIRENKSKSSLGENNPMYGRKQSDVSKYKNKIKQGIRVITHNCCYYSLKDAIKELGISKRRFYKLFKKDPLTGYYIEIWK